MTVVSFEPGGSHRWSRTIGSYRPTSSSEPTRTNSFLALRSEVLVRPDAEEVIATRLAFQDASLTEIESDLRWYSSTDGAELRTASLTTDGGAALLLADAVRTDGGVVVWLQGWDEETRVAGAPRIERRGWSDGALLAGRDLPATVGDLEGLAANAAGDLVATFTATASLTLDAVAVDAGINVVRFTDALTASWTLAMPPELDVLGVDVADDGRVAVLGGHTEAVDVPAWGASWPAEPGGIVLLFDPDGTFVWAVRYPAQLAFARFDGRGGISVGGSFDADLNVGLGRWLAEGGADGFVATLDAESGAAVSGRNVNGSGVESVSAMTVDPFGATVLGGSFTNRLSVGGSTFSSSFVGRGDAYIVRSTE